MIAHILRLTGWEWYKLQRRWMPWILLSIMVIFNLVVFWGAYVGYRTEAFSPSFHTSIGNDDDKVDISFNCADIRGGNVPSAVAQLDEPGRQQALEQIETFRTDTCAGYEGNREGLRTGLTLPYSLGFSLGFSYLLWVIVIIILAASAMGVEYGSGTLRMVLTKGTGRWQFFTGKMLALVLMAAAGLVIVAATISISSLIAALTLPAPADGAALADAGGDRLEVTLTFARLLGKVLYAFLPYMMLALCCAVLTSSAATAIAVTLTYRMVEWAFVPILVRFFDWFQNIADYLPGTNVSIWLGPEFPFGNTSEEASVLQAFLVLTAYLVILTAATLALFQRRDIAGAKGM